MYLAGWGEKANRNQATYFWALASKFGHVLAMYNLAMLHLSEPCALLSLLCKHLRSCLPQPWWHISIVEAMQCDATCSMLYLIIGTRGEDPVCACCQQAVFH